MAARGSHKSPVTQVLLTVAMLPQSCLSRQLQTTLVDAVQNDAGSPHEIRMQSKRRHDGPTCSCAADSR